MNIVVFILGVMVAIVVILVIAVVIIMLKIRKNNNSIIEIKEHIAQIERDLVGQSNEVYRCLEDGDRKTLDGAKSYTDSRYDKMKTKE